MVLGLHWSFGILFDFLLFIYKDDRHTESIVVDDKPQKSTGTRVTALQNKFSPTVIMSNRASVRFAENAKEGIF
jgi:hypothetical protein